MHFWQGNLLLLGYFCIYIKDVDKQMSVLESHGKGNQAAGLPDKLKNITSWSLLFPVPSIVADLHGTAVQTAQLHRLA